MSVALTSPGQQSLTKVARLRDKIECYAMYILAVINDVPMIIYDSELFHCTTWPFHFGFTFSAGVSHGQLRGYLFAHHLFFSWLQAHPWLFFPLFIAF